MGRGRQKAKDAKIARQLKYSGPGTDLKALERELMVGGATAAVTDDAGDDDDEYSDAWDKDDES